jgi:uncharacterized protein YggU (UPF0235/DUF167 family)
MDRVLASEARGCWFDPSRAHQLHPRRLRIIQIKVKAGARASLLVAQDDGSWLAQIAAPPVGGQANEALIALVARHFGLRRAQVRVKSGASSRTKLLQIDD